MKKLINDPRSVVDESAAILILQAFLDRRRRRTSG